MIVKAEIQSNKIVFWNQDKSYLRTFDITKKHMISMNGSKRQFFEIKLTTSGDTFKIKRKSPWQNW